MRRRIVWSIPVALLLAAIGCSSSYEVSTARNTHSSFNAFNVDAYARNGVLVFRDGTELGARNIISSEDSTRLLIETTDMPSVVPTHAIRKVVFTSRGIGLLEGFGWGAGTGFIVGSVTGLAASSNSAGNPHAFGGADMASVTLALGAAGGVLGGVIGGIWGVSAGHTYEYEFPAGAQSKKN